MGSTQEALARLFGGSWLAEGERVTSQVETPVPQSFFRWDGGARVFVTNARIMLLPPQKGAVDPRSRLALDSYLHIVELSDVRDFQTRRGILNAKLVLSLEDGGSRTIEVRDGSMPELEEGLRAAMASRIPLLQFADPDETVLYKLGGRLDIERGDVPGISESVWKRTFGFGSISEVKAKICVTSRRILLYRINNIASFSCPPFGGATVVYGAPVLQWIQIPLEAVCRVYVNKSLFRRRVHVCLRGAQPTGHFGPLTIPKLGTDAESLEGAVASGADVDVALLPSTGWTEWGSPLPKVTDDVLNALRQVIPQAVQAP